MVEMLSLLYLFATNRPTMVEVMPAQPSVACTAPANMTNGFSVAFTATLGKMGRPVRLIEVPGVAEVSIKLRDRNDRDTRLNYCNFRLPDGSIPVMEATVFLTSAEHPEWNRMTVGFPLACLKNLSGEHDFVLNFTGVRWELYADGERMDLDFPFGYPDWKTPRTLTIEPSLVRSVRLYAPALQAEAKANEPRERKGVQYWTPDGFNTWVGDVATGFYKGRYHLFYLLDRRHHSSKFGKGAHYFEHLSTADFKTWTEHEAAVPIEEQWECIGTGTPFVSDGRFCIAYGLHTERICPLPKTTLPAQEAYLKEHGRSGLFDRSAPGTPIGSSYSVSEDGGRTFKKTGHFFHTCRNPSVYRDPNGELRMLANNHGKGMWKSESVDQGWQCISPDFPPGGDCSFFFRWGKYDYIIGGFRDLWTKPVDMPDSGYVNLVQKGLDFYDGLNVPCVTEVGGGRFILAGWTHDHGWGGHLALRELIQFPDGRMGTKWLPEAVPETGPARSLDVAAVSPTGTNAVLISFAVSPKSADHGNVALTLCGGGETCRFELDLSSRRAQFAPVKPDGSSDRQKSLREGNGIHSTRQFAIENLMAVDRPFSVRLIACFDPKAGGSLVDAEIAGCRTMIAFWPNLAVSEVAFAAQDVGVSGITLAPLRSGDYE